MKIKPGAIMPDHPVCKKALKRADAIWRRYGQELVITSGKDGVHGPGSWHYFGAAFDCRTNYFNGPQKKAVLHELRQALPDYDIVEHSTHIHVEPDDNLARKWGLLLNG